MLDMGIIQPSSSPWASPTVLVEKKDGDVRFCIDYRKLNQVSKFDAYPCQEWRKFLTTSVLPSTYLPWISLRDTGKFQWPELQRRR